MSRLRERHTRSFSQPVAQKPAIEIAEDKSKLALSYIAQALVRFDPEMILKEWQLKGICQLLHKAGNAYWLLSESAVSSDKLSHALKYLKLTVLSCSKILLIVVSVF